MRERRRWKRSDRYSKVVEETLKQCSSEVVERKKRESGGDLSGCVGTLKFLCEIFSITPYLSLAGAPPFYWLPLGPRLSCCSARPGPAPGSPNRWEPVRFDRLPVLIWASIKPVQIQNSNLNSKNKKFSKNS